MKTPAAFLLLGLVAGCTARAPGPVAKPARTADVRGGLVSLERDTCYGSCPAYRLEIDTDGTVRYVGRSDVCKDEAVDRLPAAKLAELRTAIARSGFAHAREDCCDCPVSDSPTIRLTVADPPPAKTIIDSGGDCPGAPTTVRDLAEAIDTIVGVERWIGVRGEDGRHCPGDLAGEPIGRSP
jgi:hypothetical protein